MRIALNLHKTKDMELYAWIMGIENHRSLRAHAVKNTLRDYLDGKYPARTGISAMPAGCLMDDSLPKTVLLQVVIGKTDQRLMEYFGSIPAGFRTACAKAILRIMTAPYALELFQDLPRKAESVAIRQKEDKAFETDVRIPKVTPGRHVMQELPSGEEDGMKTAESHIPSGSGEPAAAPRTDVREEPEGFAVPDAAPSSGGADHGMVPHAVPDTAADTTDDDLMALFGVDYG